MEIYNKLFKRLKNGDLILTPNKRLIGFFYIKVMPLINKLKKSVWSTPDILQYETSILLQWEKQLIQKSYKLSCRLLSKNQEHLLWQSLIKKSATNFLMSAQIAKTAQQAWQLNHLWQLDYTSSSFTQTHESRTWKIWAENFISFSHDHSCIDFARETTQLIELFRTKRLTPPQRIFLVGFDEINPQIKKLFQSLEQAGAQIPTFMASDPQPCAGRLMLDNTETELQSMARWAYQSWQAGKKNIVCAVPTLLEIREQLVTHFMETFSDLHKGELSPLPFNIAAGKKFSEFSIIQNALSLLQLKQINPFNKISLLIRSPYLAYAQEEQSQRAQLDINCRRHCENTISLDKLATHSREQHCPQLSQLIQRLIPLLLHQATQQYPSQWAIYFAQKLHVCAWPGQRPLLSEEFQIIERWSELLNEFSSLDFILGKISDEDALQHLQQLTTESLFQAKTLHDPPIHVLGLLDTAGLRVDNLRVMGLDDKSWPAAAHPNPFIPYALQRTYALPHSSNERESYFSSLITQRLLKSAGTIILSHAAQIHEQSLRPSTLMAALPTIAIKDLALPESASVVESVWTTQRWEYYIDDTAPLLQAHELATNSQLFKAQAACPFQAFAKFRLQAHFVPLPQAGLNASQRGTLLHKVIETLWNHLGDQATLLKQSPQTLPALIQRAITTGIEKFSKQWPITFQPQFIAIERERLHQLLSQLIEFDKKRPPFQQVIHEIQQNFSFANLSFNLRIDRIDMLDNGSKLLIDYKTGKPAKGNWFEERLDEPQLPLYCLSQPNAKGFATIYCRNNTLKAQGFIEQENVLVQLFSEKKDKNLPSTLTELRTFWQQELEKLAHQFQEGVAKVDPKQGTHTCRYCHLQLFCRINHATIEAPSYEKSN